MDVSMDAAEFHARCVFPQCSARDRNARSQARRGCEGPSGRVERNSGEMGAHTAEAWFTLNTPLRTPTPDRGDEYQLYQTLVASWLSGAAMNGLAQVALRCLSPGVPGCYQGTEF